MQALGRPLLTTALAAALTAIALASPALSLSHELAHAAEAAAEAPWGTGGDERDETGCDLCQSLSGGRALQVSSPFGLAVRVAPASDIVTGDYLDKLAAAESETELQLRRDAAALAQEKARAEEDWDDDAAPKPKRKPAARKRR